MKKHMPPARALRRFAFRQTVKGAVIIGLLTGIMMGAQGAAYAAAYPDQHSRDLLVASLENSPALGFMAGEIRDARTPASYSIYKSIALTTLLTSIWGMLTVIRLLRGQEEDGRLEPILAGQTTMTQATLHLLAGFGYSLIATVGIAWGFITLLGMDPQVGLSASSAGLLTLGMFLPSFFFIGLGVLTSQLASTRGRAIAYTLVPLLVLFSVRGAANSVADWDWLKQYSPFGWTDRLNPVLDPATMWIIPTIIFVAAIVPLSLLLISRRDFGSGIIPESGYAKSRYFLLGSSFAYALRRHSWTFVWWLIGAAAYTALLASVAKIGADALSSSPSFAKVIGTLGGSRDDLVIAFLGFGGLFTALILLIMAAVTIGSIRAQEAKGYLDNELVQPVRRSWWLAGRIVIAIMMALAISLFCGYLTWQIAAVQGIAIDSTIVLQNSLALVGTIVLVIGIGAFFYGILPRIASLVVYAIVIWAFVVDVLKSFLSLDDIIDKTSVLHYVSFAPTKSPDWTTFAWLISIGILFALAGIWRFTQRDIVNE